MRLSRSPKDVRSPRACLLEYVVTVSVTTYSNKHARGERTSFGDLLRRYRVAAGLSQEALAERARMSARAISDLERGVHRLPYKDTVAHLAAALGLEASERATLEAAARGPRDAP